MKLMLSAFIAVYLYCFGVWVCPFALRQHLVTGNLLNYARYLISFTPFTFETPSTKVNTSINVDILYDDGSNLLWCYPNIDRFGSLGKELVGYRFIRLKDLLIRGATGKNQYLYRDLARFIAKANSMPTRHPVLLRFIVRSMPVPLPNQHGCIESSYVTYLYQVGKQG
jgi:hypothetical protein